MSKFPTDILIQTKVFMAELRDLEDKIIEIRRRFKQLIKSEEIIDN
jgi:hypothetical protein